MIKNYNFKDRVYVVSERIIEKVGPAIFRDERFNGQTIIIPRAVRDKFVHEESISETVRAYLSFMSFEREKCAALDINLYAKLNGEGYKFDESGGLFKVVGIKNNETSEKMNSARMRQYILDLSKKLKEDYKGNTICIISQRKAERDFFRSKELESVDYDYIMYDPKIVNEGLCQLHEFGQEKELDEIFNNREPNTSYKSLDMLLNEGSKIGRVRLFPNQFLEYKKRLFQIKKDRGAFNIAPVSLEGCGESVCGIKPRDLYQRLMMYCYENSDVIFVPGRAATGKTLITMAYSIKKVLLDKSFERVVIVKPRDIRIEMKEVGIEPGNKQRKLINEYANFMDALSLLEISKQKHLPEHYIKNIYDDDFDHTIAKMAKAPQCVELEALAHVLGRSLNNSVVVIDEAQNITGVQMKALMTRMGRNSKYIIMGDLAQVHHPELTETKNGFLEAIHYWLNEGYSSLISPKINYRHEATEHANDWHPMT